jgi:uncharacterized protein YndB with AHSA1/START domain
MSRIRVSTEIDAPPGRVWDAVADISTHVRWMADAESITFTSATTSGPVQHAGVVTGTGEFTLAGTGPGSTRTTFGWAERLRFPWWLGGPLGALVAKPVLRAIWKGNLRRLRGLVEAGDLP